MDRENPSTKGVNKGINTVNQRHYKPKEGSKGLSSRKAGCVAPSALNLGFLTRAENPIFVVIMYIYTNESIVEGAHIQSDNIKNEKKHRSANWFEYIYFPTS
jgi:hypothetical protein